MKRGTVIENGNLNLKNIVVEDKTNIPEVGNFTLLVKQANVDYIEFAMAFYLWSKDIVHPIPTGGYRLKTENFKLKYDLQSLVKYFEEKIWK